MRSGPAFVNTRIRLLDEGGFIAFVNSLNFVGAGVTASATGPNGQVAVSGGGGSGSVTPERDVFTGPASTLTLMFSPLAESEEVIINGIVARKVASAPSLGEYSISGTTITLGVPLVTGDRAWVTYLLFSSTGVTPHRDTFSGANATLTLVATPMSESEEIILNGLILRKVASAPSIGEYALAANVVTLGVAMVAGDFAWACYLV